jgi:hypothetical protein
VDWRPAPGGLDTRTGRSEQKSRTIFFLREALICHLSTAHTITPQRGSVS